MSWQKRPIIICGMDRSGTSLVGDLVSRWGAYGGDPRALKLADENNPNGFFESEELQDFLTELLREIDVGFWHETFESRLLACAEKERWREKAVALVETMGKGGSPWFWKEPILSLIMPFWEPFLEGCVFVIPLRDPYDSATSWERFSLSQSLREFVSGKSVNLLRWQFIMKNCLRAVEGSPVLFLPFEELITEPQVGCRKLATFLDEAFDGEEKTREDRVDKMAQAVEPRLHRQRGANSFFERADVTQAQKDLYKFLLEKAKDPALPYDPDLYPMYAAWRETMENFQQLTGLYMELETSILKPIAILALGWKQVYRQIMTFFHR